jgi:hypothetical protein
MKNNISDKQRIKELDRMFNLFTETHLYFYVCV